MREATLAVHTGATEGSNVPVSLPIYLSSTYTWDTYEGEDPQWIYSRYSNPNREAVEKTVAALEGAKHGLAFASGMAGINAAFELAKSGEHVLIAEDIYGGTYNLGKKVLPKHGVQVDYFDAIDPQGFDRAVKPDTKLVIFESPTNPTLQIADIKSLAENAKKRGVISIVDNTFSTPVLQKPLGLGIDVVCHSSTKYLGGHSDVVGGVVATSNNVIYEEMLAYAKIAGGIPGPFDCFLVSRGIKSLVPRLKMQCDTALQLARFLEKHSRVKRVHYPGLESHPAHALARRQMKAFGGVLSFELDGTAREVMVFGKKCKLARMAASLGGVETLITYPPKLSHAMLSEEERLKRGITPTLLRVSVGLEDAEDLVEDFDRALR